MGHTREAQMTKHAPATPLPWTYTTLDAESWIGSDTEVGGLVCPVANHPADSEYLIHAANAYPKLVDTLRYLAAQVEDHAASVAPYQVPQPSMQLQQGRVMAQGPLRELGEDA